MKSSRILRVENCRGGPLGRPNVESREKLEVRRVSTPVSDRLEIEKKIWHSGIKYICGVDEVGRGSVAGPVMACAVIFRSNFFHPEVKDSKLLSRNKKKELKEILCQEAISWCIGSSSVQEIDFFNIRIATFMAMRRALNGLAQKPDFILADGEVLKKVNAPVKGLIKGDNRSFTIAAASIIAKESRDTYMEDLSQKCPPYRLDRNKGYASQDHLEAIQKNGLTVYHRRSFLTKYF
jgi:ribonuclease HII